LNPASGAVGTSVTITGTNFGASQTYGTVTFNGTAAAPTSWSAMSIVVPVPAGATSGNVVVTVSGVASNGVPFTVTTGTTAAGWAFVQDSIAPTCSTASTVCDLAPLDILPSQAGSVRVVLAHTSNPVTIMSVCDGASCTGTNGGWTACLKCNITGLNTNLDMWYSLTNPGNVTHTIVHTSGPVGAISDFNLFEVLPPPGTTASFDVSGTAVQATCSGPCTGVNLNPLGGTDVIFQTVHATNPTAWNACSSPYITDNNGNCVGLNMTSGVAPTATVSPSQGIWSAIAFSAGSFPPPTKQYSVLNFTDSGANGLPCNPYCTLNIPPTGAGNLLFVESATDNGGFISSCNFGGTACVVPPAPCQINLVGAGGDAGHNFKLSSAYVLSSATGATSLGITMTGSANSFFAVWEVSAPSGKSFAVDAPCNTATRSSTFNIQGIPLITTGTNDVAFQSVFCPGGVSTVTFYPQPRVPINGAGGQFFPAQAANAILTDTGPTVPIAVWPSANNKSTAVAGIAFKTQ
jgi:hypothetical protein